MKFFFFDLVSISKTVERLRLQTQYMKDEIEIRIESIKHELEALGEKLKDEIDKCENSFIE